MMRFSLSIGHSSDWHGGWFKSDKIRRGKKTNQEVIAITLKRKIRI
jgi:hypothetical protein